MSTARIALTLSKRKIRDGRLEALKAAMRDYEDSPYDDSLRDAALGAGRAWARAEREAEGGGFIVKPPTPSEKAMRAYKLRYEEKLERRDIAQRLGVTPRRVDSLIAEVHAFSQKGAA